MTTTIPTKPHSLPRLDFSKDIFAVSQEIIEATESPLAKFDAPILKGMGTTHLDASAPRAMFLPANMGEAMELAKLMAAGNFVPPHLRGKPGDCLAVVMQATRWAMDPFAVANKTYFVNDRMAYESQLVNAVINSANVLDGRLHPTWSGSDNNLSCTVTGKLKDDPELKTRKVDIKTITTRNSPLWKQDPQQQLAYFTIRAWVRLHAPEVILGVYTPEELEAVSPRQQSARSTGPLTASMLTAQATGDNAAIDAADAHAIDAAPAETDGQSETGIPAWVEEETRMNDAIFLAGDAAALEAVEKEFLDQKGQFPADVAKRLQAQIDEAFKTLARGA